MATVATVAGVCTATESHHQEEKTGEE